MTTAGNSIHRFFSLRFKAAVLVTLAAFFFSSCKVHTITPVTPIKKPVELKKTRLASKLEARVMIVSLIIGFALGVHFDVQDLFNQ